MHGLRPSSRCQTQRSFSWRVKKISLTNNVIYKTKFSSIQSRTHTYILPLYYYVQINSKPFLAHRQFWRSLLSFMSRTPFISNITKYSSSHFFSSPRRLWEFPREIPIPCRRYQPTDRTESVLRNMLPSGQTDSLAIPNRADTRFLLPWLDWKHNAVNIYQL